MLRHKGHIFIGSNSNLRNSLISSFHNSEQGGHSGERATYKRVRLLFTWPGLRKQVKEFIKECHVTNFAWALISMDFIKGHPMSENKDLILVLVDMFTKYAHFISMKHPITVKSVARAFIDNIFKLHGLPIVIVTDRDRIFTSQMW